MVTLKEVAKLAKVSPACVSLALNGKPYVSKQAKEKIYSAVKELDYRPNVVARSLRQKKTGTIGLVLSDIANPFFPEIARGVEQRAQEYGFNVILCNTDADPSWEEKSVNTLFSKQIDGLIITSARSIDNLKRYSKEDSPIVLVNRDPCPGEFDFVGIDNVSSARVAVNHLVKLGHEKIAFVEGEPASAASFGRYEGYKMALGKAGVPLRENYVKIGYLRYEGGYRAMASFLKQTPSPTATFCANDMMALGAIDACLEKGVKVPQDMAVIGFDDMWVASLKTVQLTTVRQPRYQMGIKAIDLMIERVKGEREKAKRVILPAKLVVRRTCGKILKGEK